MLKARKRVADGDRKESSEEEWATLEEEEVESELRVAKNALIQVTEQRDQLQDDFMVMENLFKHLEFSHEVATTRATVKASEDVVELRAILQVSRAQLENRESRVKELESIEQKLRAENAALVRALVQAREQASQHEQRRAEQQRTLANQAQQLVALQALFRQSEVEREAALAQVALGRQVLMLTHQQTYVERQRALEAQAQQHTAALAVAQQQCAQEQMQVQVHNIKLKAFGDAAASRRLR